MENFKIGDTVIYTRMHKNKSYSNICKKKCKYLGKTTQHFHKMAKVVFEGEDYVRTVAFNKLSAI